MNTQVTKEILFNYFSGRATAFQKQMIDDWAKEAGNREYFYGCLALWESENSQFAPDSQTALTRHRERMGKYRASHSDNETAEMEINPRSGWTYLKAAAIVLLLLGGWLLKDRVIYQTYVTDYGQVRSLTLEDGSQVTMNANSSLRVPRFGFGDKTREVLLSGEADFKVSHKPDNKKFVVMTDRNFEVVVLGTEFVVSSRRKNARVILNNGKVQLRYKEGKERKRMFMKPGDLITFDEGNTARLRQAGPIQNFTAWKNHRLVFDGTTLSEIAQLFEDNFGQKVIISDAHLAELTISGSFSTQNAEELLETLTEASDLSYRKEGNTIIISTNK